MGKKAKTKTLWHEVRQEWWSDPKLLTALKSRWNPAEHFFALDYFCPQDGMHFTDWHIFRVSLAVLIIPCTDIEDLRVSRAFITVKWTVPPGGTKALPGFDGYNDKTGKVYG